MQDSVWITPQILWHEGMLLSPHHFQQNDKRFHQLIAQYHHVANPYAYGIHYLKLDTLANGFVTIREISAIMPDGTWVQYTAHDKDPHPLQVDLNLFQQSSIRVYLTLPKENTSHALYETTPRFHVIEGNPVADEQEHDNLLAIPRLQPALRLMACDIIPAHCTGLMIGQFVFDEVLKQTPFIPPVLFISHDMQLWQRCRNVALKLREKAHYLSSAWQNQGGSAMIAETESLLRPLFQSLPLLESLLNTSYVAPYALHQTLLQVVSLLTPLRLGKLPPVFPGYQHDDILKSFTPLLNTIETSIEGIEQSYYALPFGQEDRLFYLYLTDHYLQSTLYVGVRTPKGGTVEGVEKWMSEAIIASDFALDRVRIQRISGARRQRISPQMQLEMMPGRGVVIFEVPFDPEFMAVNQNLNIFNPNDTEETRPFDIVVHIQKGDILNSHHNRIYDPIAS